MRPRPPIGPLVTAAVVVVAGAVVVAAAGSSGSTTGARVWAAIALLAVTWSAGKVVRAWPVTTWRSTRRPHRAQAVHLSTAAKQRRQLETAIRTGLSRGWDVHTRLRPQLADLTRQRLAARGVDLDHDAAAAALVGPELWELVRPGRPRPDDRDQPGLTPAQLITLLDELEQL